MRTALFWVITQRVVVISYRRFFFQDNLSVRNYHYSLRNNPEERSSHLLRGGRLNSCNGEGSFQRKQENAVKYGARLRGWRTTESDGDASQMSYVPNGSKKIYCYYLLIFVTNSIKGIFHIHQYDNHQTTTRSVNGFISQVINRITKSMHRASLYCFYYNPLMHRYIYIYIFIHSFIQCSV